MTPPAGAARPAAHRYAYVPVVDGPHGRLGLLWFAAWVLGRVLLSIPSEFHEGTTWESLQF